MKRAIITLTAIVLIAITAIGITHYYAVRILSASRAYSTFEYHYANGEKDASRHLMSYLYSEDEVDYLLFKNDINIPLGDRIARETLLAGGNDQISRIGFLIANNNKGDLQNLIWYYKNFKDVGHFKQAVQSWETADALLSKLNTLGTLINKEISRGKLSADRQEDLLLQINTISDNLAIWQQKFSDTLASNSGIVNHYVYIADVVIASVIIFCTALLAGLMLWKLNISKKVIVEQNQALHKINEHMDRFVYALSHDLRAPLASMTGLVNVLEKEKSIEAIPEYAHMMRESIQLQDNFIKDVLAGIKDNSHASELCNLKDILTDVISQNAFFTEGKRVQFMSELDVWEVKCNTTDLKVVFNNLISNAIKYADFTKPEQWIKVKSYVKGKRCIIEVEDNGIGIKAEQKNSIFNKFFKSGENKKSMGLGLYFTRKAIEDMNGTISVQSFSGKGTSFIVSLPL